jgi:hypothetical protein
MLGKTTTGRELNLAEMIRDPMVQQVMRSDGVTTEELLLVMQTAKRQDCQLFIESNSDNAISS